MFAISPNRLSNLGQAAPFCTALCWLTCQTMSANAVCALMQVVEVIEPQRRDQRIDELLQKYHKSRKNRVIVFVLYKKEASRVESLLVKRGWKVSNFSLQKQ